MTIPTPQTRILTGKIREWDAEKGFGWLDSGGRKVFLHRREFAERHKRPAVGDLIHFEMGEDVKKRPCAVRASHLNDGGRFLWRHVFVLLFLLFFPMCALVESGLDASLAAGAVVTMSAGTYWAYATDKQRARQKGWRLSEKSLHLLELAGGWPGAYIAQRRLRHKVSKFDFQWVFWAIILLHQAAAFDFLRDWRWTRQIMAEVQEMGGQSNTKPDFHSAPPYSRPFLEEIPPAGSY